MPRLSLISPYSLEFFVPGSGIAFGGAELRCHLFGSALAAAGDFSVTMVVMDHPALRELKPGGKLAVIGDAALTASPAPSAGASAPSLAKRLWTRFKVQVLGGEPPVDTRHFAAWAAADADIYGIFGVSDLAATLAVFCRRHGKKMVLFLSTDTDLSPGYRARSFQTNDYGSRAAWNHHALMSADLIVAQTRRQQALLAERFARQALVVPSPIDLRISATQMTGPAGGLQNYVLWIGKSDTVKQPDLLVGIARACPELKFVMVLNNTDAGIFEAIRASAPANLSLIESFKPAEADDLFSRALVLVNTSRFEGFPNTYLQAGKHGIPVLSLNADPDGMLEEPRCGVCAHGSLPALTTALQRVAADTALHAEYSRNIRAYVHQHHDIEQCTALLRAALEPLAAGVRPCAA